MERFASFFFLLYNTNMFETSRDLVNIALTFGIVLLTILFAIFLYYSIKIIKDVAEMLHEVKDTVEEFRTHLRAWEAFLDSLKDRMTNMSAYVPLIVDGISKIVEFIGKKKEERKKKSST